MDAFNKQYEGKYKATYEPHHRGPATTGQEMHMAGGTIGDVHYAHQSAIKFQEYAVKGVAIALDPYIAKDKNFKLDRLAGQRPRTPTRSSTTRSTASPSGARWPGSSSTGTSDMLKKTGIPEPTPDWTWTRC